MPRGVNWIISLTISASIVLNWCLSKHFSSVTTGDTQRNISLLWNLPTDRRKIWKHWSINAMPVASVWWWTWFSIILTPTVHWIRSILAIGTMKERIILIIPRKCGDRNSTTSSKMSSTEVVDLHCNSSAMSFDFGFRNTVSMECGKRRRSRLEKHRCPDRL